MTTLHKILSESIHLTRNWRLGKPSYLQAASKNKSVKCSALLFSHFRSRSSARSRSTYDRRKHDADLFNAVRPTCLLCQSPPTTSNKNKSRLRASVIKTRAAPFMSNAKKVSALLCKTSQYPGATCQFSTSARCLDAVRIDGKAIAQDIKDEVKAEVAMLVSQGLRAPHLTVLLVGNDPASVVYVRNKARAAEYTGITCEVLRLPENISERALLKEIDLLNSHPDVDGILVQLPLPAQVTERTVCDAVLPDRDVDGFNVLNVGRVCVDQDAFMPATPAGVLEIIRRLEIETWGKNAVVCGRSKNVGMPIAMQLHSGTYGGDGAGNATTTICHRHTPREELIRFTQAADIIVTATGVPGLITADMVSDGVVVIDIGITRVEDDRGRARLVGDVDYEGVSKKASMITPVPGGVGPVTVAMVIKNTLIAYKKGFGG